MNLHKHQLYLLEQHSESFKSWSVFIRVNTEDKSLIVIIGPMSRYKDRQALNTTLYRSWRWSYWQHTLVP